MLLHRAGPPVSHGARSGMTGRVLVTGGAGFIGSHVVDALIDAGKEVVVLDSLPPEIYEGLDYPNQHAAYLWGDIRDPNMVRRALRGVTAVCHHAGVVGIERSFSDVIAYVSHNDLGSAELLRGLHEMDWRGPLLLASSMVVYGEGAYTCRAHGSVHPGPRPLSRLAAGAFEASCPRCGQDLRPAAVDETAPLDPRSIYAATKVHQEQLFGAFGRAHDARVVLLRYHNVYGPRMPRATSYAGVASIFKDALNNGRRPEVFEDGRQLRDFVHVTDVAAANVAALGAPVHGPFNIASGSPKTIADVARAMTEAIQPSLEPCITGAFRPGDVRHVFASPRRALEVLGWQAQTGFPDGIRGLVAEPSSTRAAR